MDYQISTVNVNACGLKGLSRSSSLKNSFRRHREPIWITNIRQQLTEQLKCLDFRLEMHIVMLTEVHDFYRRRAEVESEYAYSMEKLVKQTMTKHRNEKQKRESWPDYSTYTVWQTLLGTTRKMGSDHGTLGGLYSSQMSLQISQLSDYIQRVYKRCRDMVVMSQEELVRVLTELQASLKTYQKYHGEFVQAEAKLKTVEDERSRLDQSTERPAALLRRRLRNLEKQIEKKQLKHLECSLKAVKARNEYLLCLEAANSSVQKYFMDNISELIDATDFGYHDTLSHMMQMHMSAEDFVISSRKGCLDLINQQVRGLCQAMDKQSFLERYTGPFSLPQRFSFQPHLGDKISHLSVEESLHDDVLDRLGAIQERLKSLLADSDEASTALQKIAATFLLLVKDRSVDATPLFQDGVVEPQASALDQIKNQSNRSEAEELYFNKFREYHSSSNLIARLQAKFRYMERALVGGGDSSLTLHSLRSVSMSSIATKKREIIRTPPVIRPKLFGGTLEEYIQGTGKEIPLIIRSCVRIINLYGMHHQGIFRIPGSQKEIIDFKNQFERGKDPFADKMDGKDMDSVAGVLKLYFRELREPLFPSSLFDELASFISHRNFTDPNEVARSIYDVRHLLMSSIKPSVIVVLRYFFSFLNHLSEFSDENMMDAFNLSICLGPTLLPVPSDRDLVQYQGHVTELVKNIIIYQEDIFPRTTDGPVYEKCILQAQYEIKSGSKGSLFDEDDILDDFGSGDEIMAREALALYDFQARTDRELSFKKGDSINVFEKVSEDWWEAIIDNQEGLIPDKYITILPRDISISKTAMNPNRKALDKKESLPSVNKCSLEDNAPDNVKHTPTENSHSPCLRPSNSVGSRDNNSSHTCVTSDPSPEATGIRQGQENMEEVLIADPVQHAVVVTADLNEPFKVKTTEELKSDIDAALANVFSGIEFLNGAAKHRNPSPVISKPGVKHRPDLVNDLPANSALLTEQKGISVETTAKFYRPTRFDVRRTSPGTVAAMPDRKTDNNLRKNVNVLRKGRPQRPQSGNFQDFKIGWQCLASSSSSEAHQHNQQSSRTRSNDQPRAAHVASSADIVRPTVRSHNFPELARSHSSWEESKVWLAKRDDASPVKKMNRAASAVRSESKAVEEDFILAADPFESAWRSDASAARSRRRASAVLLRSSSLVEKEPQLLKKDPSLESVDLGKKGTVDSYTPSFI